MFTGIVERQGVVTAVEPREFGRALSVRADGWAYSPDPGGSVAVNGCCLTVARKEAGGGLGFDVIRQTLDMTTLGGLAAGDLVNLEAPVTAATMLGGHVVQGHVDGVGVVRHVTADGTEHRLRIEPPPALMEYVVDKGSIAVDGVSLTVAALGPAWFEVALIPETIQRTSLGAVNVGDRLNLEADYVAKVVVSWLRGQWGSLMADRAAPAT